MQVASQSSLPPAPPDAYAIDPVSSSRRKYQQQSPQSGESRRDRSSTRSTTSPQQTSHRQSRQTSGLEPSLSSPETPYQGKYPSPGSSQPSNQNSARGQPMLNVTHPSPLASSPGTSPSHRQSRREQQLYPDYGEGPPIPPPPRTSSNQRVQISNLIGNVPLADKTVTYQQVPGNQPFSPRDIDSNGAYNIGDREEDLLSGRSGGNGHARITDDTTAAAANAARTRRRVPTSPESAASAHGLRSQEPNTVAENRSNYRDAAGPGKLNREESEVINRVVVTDPQIDIEREQERQAEAVPVKYSTGLGLVGAEGVDDGGRGGGHSRQDNSSSTSRRKETKFGEYILGQTLGEGEFGKVKLGWKKDGSVQVAIKLIRRESLGTNPSRLPKIYREISILRGLAHPNIVRLHEMVETDRNIGIILEYASGGELFDYILTHRYLKDNSARRLFAQLVSGVGYLHKKGIVHRDLKLENLLLDRNRNIIITDFGFANTFDPRDELSDEIEYNLTNRDFVKSRDLERVQKNGSRRGDLMQTSCGSPCYAAPELVVTDSLYTGRKVDVWSCGVILYAMLAGYLPFDDDPANPEGDNINLLYKYIVATPLTFPEFVTPHARDLLRRILVPDPRKRADLFEVARHSWLSDFAHVVAHVTSSTTTVGEIANTTTASGDLPDAPLLARSASVREPTKSPYTGNVFPIGALSHQGKIDPEQPSERTKAPRDPKRRTVQVEYVAPQSQTTRGEATSLVGSPTAASSPPSATTTIPRTRIGAGNQGAVDSPRQVSAASTTKPLPQKPGNEEDPRSDKKYLVPLPSSRSQQRPISSQMNMAPPTRPARDVPRSVSDSTSAFGQLNAPSARPATSSSIVSGTGRLPSRGNSYSQPLAPTVAVTNAQGSLAQPNNGKQYHISAPIPHPEPYISDSSIGRPSTQHASMGYSASSTAVPRETSRGHKRSNTLGNMFGKSGSFFGGRSQVQLPQESLKKQNEKRYPPTSMKQPITSDEAKRRPSTDSRRSSSFGIGRKSTDLDRQDKPRRFSLLPASFSFKSFTGSVKDQAVDNPAIGPGQASHPQPQAPLSRGQSRHQGMAFGRGQSRSNSYSTDNSIPTPYDGLRDQRRDTSVPQPRKPNQAPRSVAPPPPTQPAQYGSAPLTPLQEPFNPTRPLEPGQSYLLPESSAPTPSENSQGLAQRRSQYPGGFDSYDDEPGPPMLQNRSGRGPAVLQKNNRRFADAYDQEQDPGSGTGGHHAGSSGAAKRVMDFFRRRGKARSGDDR